MRFSAAALESSFADSWSCAWRPDSHADGAKQSAETSYFSFRGQMSLQYFSEPSTAMHEPQGQRLGDRFALTQVVEGFGAKDFVTEMREWFLHITERFEQNIEHWTTPLDNVQPEIFHLDHFS